MAYGLLISYYFSEALFPLFPFYKYVTTGFLLISVLTYLKIIVRIQLLMNCDCMGLQSGRRTHSNMTSCMQQEIVVYFK